MTYTEYEAEKINRRYFDFLFGSVQAPIKWNKYREAGSIEAWVRMDADAKKRIDLDIKVITRGAM